MSDATTTQERIDWKEVSDKLQNLLRLRTLPRENQRFVTDPLLWPPPLSVLTMAKSSRDLPRARAGFVESPHCLSSSPHTVLRSEKTQR